MKKIAIITLFGYENYGNRLQMFASQKIYEKLGFNVEIIKNFTLRSFKGQIKDLLLNISIFLFKRNRIEIKQNKINRFKENGEKYFKESSELICTNKIKNKFHENYDYFSVGSDQIWSYKYSISRKFSYLKFVPKNKRIALSPSFGQASIPKSLEKEISENLRGFENLSVREDAGAKLIKDLTGKRAEVLVDPTMILTRNEWIDFSEKHRSKPLKKYILTYFLGPLPEKVKDIINKNKEYKIVKLGSFEMPEYYDTNPSEWIDFIKDASLFLTDSFHGVVFSHILKTPFVVYNRIGGESMNSRIETILKKFNTEQRQELTKDSYNLFNLDFLDIDYIIGKEKEKTINYLKKALNIND